MNKIVIGEYARLDAAREEIESVIQKYGIQNSVVILAEPTEELNKWRESSYWNNIPVPGYGSDQRVCSAIAFSGIQQ
jgi:hypothetical protein